jgi:hypothetical protein
MLAHTAHLFSLGRGQGNREGTQNERPVGEAGPGKASISILLEVLDKDLSGDDLAF